jgi:hypothetical protein
MKDHYFHCFNRWQQRVLSTQGAARITNRCFTDWEPSMKKDQIKPKRRSMTEAEVAAVRQLTGHKPFLEEMYV